MKPIPATRGIARTESRLGWLLAKLYEESKRRGSRLKPPVLVGGTALRRGYGLTRPSIDLDFAVADVREMRLLIRTTVRIATERWTNPVHQLRADGEEGWGIVDDSASSVLKIGGLVIPPTTLELAVTRRDTWTLPMQRLAEMKITTALRRRTKARDLYDIGFIAAHYPGDITEGQAREIAEAGAQASQHSNRWTEDHIQDDVLKTQPLVEIGRSVVRAGRNALVHIEGARKRQWMNQSQAADELREANCAKRQCASPSDDGTPRNQEAEYAQNGSTLTAPSCGRAYWNTPHALKRYPDKPTSTSTSTHGRRVDLLGS